MKKPITIMIVFALIFFLASCGHEAVTEEGITSKEVSLENASVGDVVTFGEYEQDGLDYNGKEPIEWIVLAKEDQKLLLVSKYGLDYGPYNDEWIFTTWENCTLRRRLNGTFFNEAFSPEEQSLIATTEVSVDVTGDGTDGIYPGKDTLDKIFLLSVNEVKKYFPSYSDRICKGTEKYWQRIANDYPAFSSEEDECDWYLRTLGESSPRIFDSIEGSDWVANVHVDGSVGIVMTAWRPTAIRPAVWVKTNLYVEDANDSDSSSQSNNFDEANVITTKQEDVVDPSVLNDLTFYMGKKLDYIKRQGVKLIEPSDQYEYGLLYAYNNDISLGCCREPVEVIEVYCSSPKYSAFGIRVGDSETKLLEKLGNKEYEVTEGGYYFDIAREYEFKNMISMNEDNFHYEDSVFVGVDSSGKIEFIQLGTPDV